MSGVMDDVHPARYDFDFEELKATEGYNPPDDFLIRVLPLDAGGALPGRGETKERVWYEYPSPFAKDWNLQSAQLQLEEERERRSLDERERRRQQLEADLHRRRLVETERQQQEDGQKQPQYQKKKSHRRRLDEDERHRLRQEQDDLYLDEMWANSPTREHWVPDDETPTSSSSSSPASDARQDVEEHHVHVEEHHVHVKMHEYDGAGIPRYRLFKSEANTQELLLGFPLKIPYYIYAGRCNLNLDGYELRYAELFPDFHIWGCSWVRPTTYEGDSQYVDFWSELMGEVEYANTRDRVLAKAIAIANRGFRKMLYFQIEIAVKDCMMLLEYEEKLEQTRDLYGYIASEIYFEKQKYESVLERILNGHEVLRYELTELGGDVSEDDAWEMRELVDHLVRSTPVELRSATRFDPEYKQWVYKQIYLQYKREFNLYVNYIVKKLNMAQDLNLAHENTS